MERYKSKFCEDNILKKVIEWLIETEKGDEKRIEELFKDAKINHRQIADMYNIIEDGGGFD